MKLSKAGKSILIIMLLAISTAGCSMGKTSPDSRASMIQSINPKPGATNNADDKKVNLAEKVKKDIQSLEAIYDVAVIAGKKETLVAYKVKHMKRFGMKKIEKEINGKLEKNYPGEDFIVSSDFKIFIEAVELREKLKDPAYPEKKAQKQLQKIISLKKEMT